MLGLGLGLTHHLAHGEDGEAARRRLEVEELLPAWLGLGLGLGLGSGLGLGLELGVGVVEELLAAVGVVCDGRERVVAAERAVVSAPAGVAGALAARRVARALTRALVGARRPGRGGERVGGPPHAAVGARVVSRAAAHLVKS